MQGKSIIYGYLVFQNLFSDLLLEKNLTWTQWLLRFISVNTEADYMAFTVLRFMSEVNSFMMYYTC